MQISGLSQDQIAVRVGKNRSTVANAIRLLKLPEDMQDALVDGKLTAGHARALLAVKEPTARRELFKKIVETGMVVRKAEEMAGELNSGSPIKPSASKKSPSFQKDPNIGEIEQKFIEALGTKVVLNGTLEKGKIEIDYFSKEDLDRLYSLIVK
jgi:ParB family chromosome partitioning protein